MSLQDNTNKLNDILLTVAQLDLSSLNNKPTESIVYEIDITSQSAYVSGYVGTEPNVYIASKYNNYPVTFIKENAFKNNSVIQSITMPNSIVTIGSQAFHNCENLVTVNFGNNLKDIGNEAFLGCNELKEIHLPENLKVLGYGAFEGCKSLEKVVIPNGVTELNNRTFAECSELEEVKILGKLELLWYLHLEHLYVKSVMPCQLYNQIKFLSIYLEAFFFQKGFFFFP